MFDGTSILIAPVRIATRLSVQGILPRRIFMKKKAYILIPLVLLVLLALACDLPIPSFGNGDGDGDGDTSFVGGDCQSGTTRIEMNRSVSGSISGGSFPDNCAEFCLWVPENGSRLDITITGFDVDLDLYVDPDYQVLQSSEIGEASWESIDFGTEDESVSISNPGGRYYIQVCSYEGTASSFTVETDYR
jgi:hypothetical protein